MLFLKFLSCTKELKSFAKARYYYYQNTLYKTESQIHEIIEIENLYLDKNLDECHEKINSFIMLYPNSYYSMGLKKAEKNIRHLLEYEDFLCDTYIINNEQQLTLQHYRCAKLLAKINPKKYNEYYYELLNKVSNTIQEYKLLYNAIETGDKSLCIKLIIANGWCWFEQSLQDSLLNNSDEKIMPVLEELKENESIYCAIQRLSRSWGILHDDELHYY